MSADEATRIVAAAMTPPVPSLTVPMTLQPTALVHEAYLRLVDQRRVVWQNRGQFFGIAAQLMRRILVDRARARKMAKRSGQWARVTVEDAARAIPPVNVDVL